MAAIVVAGLYGCAGMEHVAVKRPAPPFKVSLIAGGEAESSQFSGKPLVLIIGASWCPHCIHELPELTAAHEKYKNDAGFLMVFIKSELGDVKELISEHDLRFMVGYDKEAEIAKAYGVKGMPVTFFIDKDGNIVDEYLGGLTEDALTRRIDPMLGSSGR